MLSSNKSKACTIVVLFLLLFFVVEDEVLAAVVLKQTPLTHRGLLNWIFHPNLDFRAKISMKDGEEASVKEAVATSLGEGKSALEDSAKSAADVTKETAQKLFSSSPSSPQQIQSNEL
ncbi:hypothetical protein QVD17_26501 [Tagetes erecta]|uniref:Uncharacterized protein n=1 Tax=Tagetes erecta TaxID=13708 RepID=A0AAD8K7J5_TARER|nr:hypothetical protein QVD17_26501 [Tagetes erecta]